MKKTKENLSTLCFVISNDNFIFSLLLSLTFTSHLISITRSPIILGKSEPEILNIHNFFLIHRRLCVRVDWGMKADVRVSATFFFLLLNFEIRDKIIFTIRIRDGKFPFYPNQVYFISEKFPDIFMTDLLLVNFVPLRWRKFLDFLEPSRLGFIDEFVWAELDKVAIEFFSKSTHPENNITKK